MLKEPWLQACCLSLWLTNSPPKKANVYRGCVTIFKKLISLLLFFLFFFAVPVQFTILPQNVTANLSNPIVVNCRASGFPTPSISWKKHIKGTAVSKDPNTQNSGRSDAGMYVCTASNGVGQDKAAEVYVTVQCKSIFQHVIEFYVAENI